MLPRALVSVAYHLQRSPRKSGVGIRSVSLGVVMLCKVIAVQASLAILLSMANGRNRIAAPFPVHWTR